MTYFDLATRPDTDDYLAQFTDDAVVEDEGHEHHGIAAIRAWRKAVPGVRYDVRASTSTVEVSGDFPGSPVTLTFAFTHAPDGRISALRIRA